MVKFDKLIHKETGKVIHYSDWLESLTGQKPINFPDTKSGEWVYKAELILFGDDFEIVYE
ncbi:hypothetical protein [uncultured Clostridium sp.]|uniref:hypothetical protein n=1 Tax=uncultured Clostridium sp. TaxID=59620 RepID=UPI0028E30F4C|nr:hypothetical protein [uncultured Clostridium sp.]